MDIRDSDNSELSSSKRGVNFSVTQHEGERRQLHDSTIKEYFFDKDENENTVIPSQRNGTDKVTDESIGTYFRKKSSLPDLNTNHSDMCRRYVAQVLQESNVSISSMDLEQFLSGPARNGMSKEAILAHVLTFCKVKSLIDARSGGNFLASTYLEFQKNPEPANSTSSVSVTSKNSSSSQGSSVDTIKASLSPGHSSCRQPEVKIPSSFGHGGKSISAIRKDKELSIRDHQSNSLTKPEYENQCKNRCTHVCSRHTIKLPPSNFAVVPESAAVPPKTSKYLAEKPVETMNVPTLLNTTIDMPDFPHIEVDKHLIGFSTAEIGDLKTKTVKIYNMNKFDLHLKCGLQNLPENCFWIYTEMTIPPRKLEMQYVLRKFERIIINIAFKPVQVGDVHGSFIIKFARADSMECSGQFYRKQVKLTGFGVPTRRCRQPIPGKP